jgi:hypothetical protein
MTLSRFGFIALSPSFSRTGNGIPPTAISSLFLKEFVSAFILSMRYFFAPKKTLNYPF